MARRPILREADIARALKAMQSAGLTVARCEIQREKIVIYSSDGVRHEPASDLDAWREKRNARST
jgi:serine phosphatase RsbU (regulator of sigma subunit)